MATTIDLVNLNAAFAQVYYPILSSTLKEFPLLEGPYALPACAVPYTTFQTAYVKAAQSNPLAQVNDGTGLTRYQPDTANKTYTLSHLDAGWLLSNHELLGYSFGKERLREMRRREALRAEMDALSSLIVSGLATAISADTAAITLSQNIGTATRTIPFFGVRRAAEEASIAWGNNGAIYIGPELEQNFGVGNTGKTNFGVGQAVDAYAAFYMGHSYGAGVATIGFPAAIPSTVDAKANNVDDILRTFLSKFPLGYTPDVIYTSREGKALIGQYRNVSGLFAPLGAADTTIDGIPIVAVDQIVSVPVTPP